MADGRHLEKSKNLNIFVTDFDKIWHADASPPSGPQSRIKLRNFKNPIWRRPSSWKNRKILIPSRPIDRFWRNLARWCVSTLWTIITNKISRFQKSKMAAAAILKIRKIAISPQWSDQFWQNLDSDASGPYRYRHQIKIHDFENPRHLEKSKNLTIFTTVWPILTKFGMLMRLDPPHSQ